MHRAFALLLLLAASTRIVAQQPPNLPREFRGVWVATVSNIDWPSKKTLTTQQQQVELLAILDKCVELKLNAVIFQVRPMLYILAASMLAMLLVYRYRSSALGRILERFGAHSYGIFLVHILALRALLSQWSPEPELLARTPWWLVAAIMFGQWAVCAGASYALVAALARIGPLSRLVSNR